MKQLKDDTLKYASDFLGVYGDLPAKSIKTGEDSTVKDLFADLSYKKAINASYHDYWINKSNGR